MYPSSVGQPGVHEGHRIVKAAAHRSGEPLREAAYVALTGKPHIGGLKAGTAIEKDLIWAVDQDVGDSWLAK
jgi:hypothetical protein